MGSPENIEDSEGPGSRHEPALLAPPPRTARQHQLALIDVERRAQGGIYIYLPCWLAIAGTSGLFGTEPRLVAAVSLFFLLAGIGRFVLHRNFAERVERNEALARTLFLTLLLGNAGLFGALGLAADFWAPLMPARQLLILVGAVICASATMALAISPVIRIGMPAVTLLPFLLSLGCEPAGFANAGIGVLTLLFLLYLLKSSKYVHDDYWRAVDAQSWLRVHAHEFERLSITDPLTQVHSRLHFERRMTDEWQHATRRSEPLTLMIIDLDHFRRINETHGHAVGDLCLRHVAAVLKASLNRATDLLARFGGEEFAVLLPVTEGGSAAGVAERLRAAVAGLVIDAPGGPVRLTCSIGLATVWPSFQGASATALLMADTALQRAKEGGRNRVVVAGVAGATGAAQTSAEPDLPGLETLSIWARGVPSVRARV